MMTPYRRREEALGPIGGAAFSLIATIVGGHLWWKEAGYGNTPAGRNSPLPGLFQEVAIGIMLLGIAGLMLSLFLLKYVQDETDWDNEHNQRHSAAEDS